MAFAAEIRLAVRRWASRPALAITAVVTLSLGIAATTAIFSVVHAVLLKPLPWRDADQLVSIYVARPHWRESPVLANSWNTGNLSWPIFEDLKTRARTLSEVATWNRVRPTLNSERNEQVYGLQVSAGFLPMIGVTPFMGRFFTEADDTAASEACVISYEAWERRYGGSAAVLGQRVSLNETPYTIVGVLPPGFDFTGTAAPEYVIPWGNVPAAERHVGNHFMNGLARLKSGVSLADATADADPLIRGTEKPEEKQARLLRLEDDQRGRSRAPLAMLLAAAALLLLITCANVAGLLLGEGTARRHEIAVRLALGGSRATVVRQMLVECIVLAIVSISLAVVAVYWATPMLASLAPAQLPRAGEIAVSLPVLAFATVSGLLTIVLFGVVPAVSFARTDASPWMRAGSRSISPTQSRAQHVLVAAEVALAVLLVAGASLFGETLMRMTSEPLGFTSDNLIVVSLRLPRGPAVTAEQRRARTDDLAEKLSALPGAAAVTLTSTAPFSGSYGSNSLTIEGKPGVKAESNRHIVSSSYFETLEIPIVKGRGFDATDRPGTFTAVVSQEFERQYLDNDGVGKRFTLNGNTHEVIGVVPTTKHRGYSDQQRPAMYLLNRQLATWATSQFIVRTTIQGATMTNAIRRTVEVAEPSASIISIETMTEMMRKTVAEERFRAQLSIAFGGTALLLAGIGVYGLIARLVLERRREIGVRLAIGAPRAAVVRMVLQRAMVLVFAGLLVGVPAAFAAARLMQSMLYGVAPTAPHTFLMVIGLLTAAAVVSAGLPAMRAANSNPANVLRAD